MSKEEFLYIVQGQVEENDIRLLEQAKLVPTEDVCTGNAVLDSWLNWETELRNELIRQRNAPFQTEGQNHIREADTVAGHPDRVRPAIQADTPLEGERILDQARWQFLDDLSVGHYFDLEALIIYYLQLKILNRWQQFTPEKGEEKFQQIYDAITSDMSVMSDESGQVS
ncbi:MAG: DUF2764 domain-containing protein [Spirochaetales bacterium]|nr:DUF2764 domain-containing protein [Spirochaetales bacterium]MCF7939912.1 DUF2764 domain-containing protein [Spirochaetales bacterium]